MGGIPLVALEISKQQALRPDPVETYYATQQKQQQLQTGALDLEAKRRALADQNIIMQTLAQHDGDVEKALPALAGRVTPQAFKDLANFHLDTKYKLSQIADNDLKVQQDAHDRTAQLFDYTSKLPDDQLAQQW